MSYWAGLFGAEVGGGVAEGIRMMLALAYKILSQQKKQSIIRMLPAP
jgi:hypothetical protein